MFQVLAKKCFGARLRVSIRRKSQAPQKILGINPVSKVGDEAHVSLVHARQIKDGQTGLALDIGKKLIEPIAMPGEEILTLELALRRRSYPRLLGGGRNLGRSGLRLNESPKSFT